MTPLTTALLRLDKKCGKSGIAANKKCSKSTMPVAAAVVTGIATGGAAAAIFSKRQWTPAVERAFKEAVATIGIPSAPPKGSTFLAKGYAGAVYAARDSKSVFKLNYKRNLVGRRQFLREVLIQAKLHDRGVNTPAVFAVDTKRSIAQFEYMQGYQNLTDIAKSGSAEVKSSYAKQFLKEMAKLHKAGYGHGDMHLGNVMVKGGDVKLIDWGYAKPLPSMAASGRRNDMEHIKYMLGKLDPAEQRRFTAMLKESGLSGSRPTQQSYNSFWDRYFNASRKDQTLQLRLDKKCGKSGIAPNKKCSKPTPSPVNRAALGVGAVAGIAALAVASRRRFGRRDPNFKGFASPGEDWGRIEAEARQGGKKWKVFEDNKKAVAAACAGAKLDNFIRGDAFVPRPVCGAGRGAYGQYIVHPSERYGIKYMHNSNRPPDETFKRTKESLLSEGDVLRYANQHGVPAPRLMKATSNVLVMEHLQGFEPLRTLPAARGGYALTSSAPIDLKRKLLNVFETMHSVGIAHNDPHFNNILFNPRTGDLRIIDFGLATFARDEPDMFKFELQHVAEKVGLRETNAFLSRWSTPLDMIEHHLRRGKVDRSEVLVRGYYKSLRFQLEHEHVRYTR